MEEKTKGNNVVFLRSTSIINDSRVVKETQTLEKNGYNVKILGWDRDGFLENESNINFESTHIFIKAFKRKSKYGDGMKSIFKLFQFQIWLCCNLIKLRKNIDIIHSCDLDTALPAYIVAKIFKKKLVYDIFDYYIDSHYVPPIFRNKIEKLEINIINNADLTIICTNERKKQIRKAKPKKCIVIYNTPKISENILNSKIIKSSTDKFKIVYVGILQECRLLKEIGEEIKKYPEIELHIGGFGKLETYFFELSKEFNNIFYYGQMKYEDVLKLEKDSDILFATYNPKVANHKFSAPNKLYESMALGKPIIVCKGTGIDKIVEEENIGYSISYDSKEFIKFAYKIKENINIKNILEANAKNIYNKKYSWDKMSKKLLEEYKILGEK